MKIGIIELSKSHAECIYTQLLFFKRMSDVKITLIRTPNLLHSSSDFQDEFDEVKTFDIDNSSLTDLWKVRKYVVNKDFDKIIFNTGQGDIAKKLSLFPYPKKIEFIGILHNTKKLQRSIGQKIIGLKCKKYFILADYLLRNTTKSKTKFTSIYPIYFPNYKLIDIPKEDGEVWITIPGSINFKRRPYQKLIQQISSFREYKNIKFILLGSSNTENIEHLEKLIEQNNIESNIIYWKDFLSNIEFHSYLKKSDYILPFVEITSDNDMYNFQITGTFNLAYAHQKVMILHETLKKEEFRNNAVFYSDINIRDVILGLIDTPREFIFEKKFDFNYQLEKFSSFILS